MNLINDQWMRVKCRDGSEEVIAPYQLTEFSGDKTIVDVLAPRADLKGALYQFLIGLVQTTFAPSDTEEWYECWVKPPRVKVLQEVFEKQSAAFELDKFMQDYDLPKGKEQTIEALYIDAPGINTVKKNSDHFVKGGTVNQVDLHWAAISLFTLQINAPEGGSGHRVSLRGGGPLTTLVMPPDSSDKNTLWHRVWLNVLTQDDTELLTGNNEKNKASDIFPWLAPTRTSEKKNGETHPEDAHPYQMYWCMPRRIRLDFEQVAVGFCDISGQQSNCLLTRFIAKKHGVKYAGNWQHPLTPYNIDPKNGALSIKAQPGGITYRYWLGMVLSDSRNHKQVSKVVDVYKNRKEWIDGNDIPHLWAFGFDMANMKARCWYEANLPLFNVADDRCDDVCEFVADMIDATVEVVGNVRKYVKEAWFNSPKNIKGDKTLGDLSFLDSIFWAQTESRFYQFLSEAVNEECDADVVENKVKQQWKAYLKREALSLFDQWAMSNGNEDGDMKRTVKARTELEKWLRTGKQIKKLAA